VPYSVRFTLLDPKGLIRLLNTTLVFFPHRPRACSEAPHVIRGRIVYYPAGFRSPYRIPALAARWEYAPSFLINGGLAPDRSHCLLHSLYSGLLNAGHGGAVQTGARSSNPLIPCSPSCTRNASLKSRPNQSKRRQYTACDISFPLRPMRIDVGCCKDLQGAQDYPHPSNQGKTCKRGFQTTKWKDVYH